ncbi:MAG: flavodoxin-dependent (E)-4-hydroxy-3-methylbut-2-enyl-diphosphate synthase [Actinobacteria bacterium]|nr:flavodoxin-dependent (E)-4-hydroxy-3-methylbut-2-enyl-diphosphate synthase [Actinomycetota bacterium]
MEAARTQTHQVKVGDVAIGGGAPVAVQSMTNAAMVPSDHGPVLDLAGNLKQIELLADAGCEIARVAIPNRASLATFADICAASPLPVVADIHFDHLIAIGAARAGASKLRINPGNIGTLAEVDEVIEVAGECGIPIRIGVNAGSLDSKWRDKSDWTLAERLCASVTEYVEHFNQRSFHDIVISAKAHDVLATIETYRLLSKELPTTPLHLGVTEAGTIRQGTVKSSVGLGVLLCEGIGDTFRVSLTAPPEEEIAVAWEILAACGLRRRSPELVSCPTCGRCQVDMISLAQEVERRLQKLKSPIKVAVMGCVVNGPGEAADADIGVACGRGAGIIFAGGKQIRKVPVDQIVDALFEEIAALEAKR